MNRTIIFFILIIVTTSLYSDEAQQTDWSGGSGVPGPVFNWSSLFYTSTDINWYDFPGQLKLFPINIRFTICEYSSKAYSVYSIDIDSDGDKDILVAVQDDITWWENADGSGTSWIEHTIDESFNGAYSVHSTDIDGDGDNDVLGAASSDHDITWWKNVDGSGTNWIEYTIDENFNGAISVFSADIDGDGYKDVLGAAFSADDITWWKNVDGSGIYWIEHTIDENFNGARSVYSVDIDGDGDNDVLGAASEGDDIIWWENANGSGSIWVEHIIDGEFNGARSVYSIDIDADGDNDVLGAARNDHEITWWENLDGSGSSWYEHIIDGDFEGYSVYCADINNDGNNNVIGAGRVYPNGAVAWWGSDLYTTNGILVSSILDTRTDPVWQTVDWNCSTPFGTSVFFQVRASDDSGNMGEWSDTLMTPCNLNGILAESDSYVQYRAMLNVMNSDSTPILFDVTLAWDPPLGIGEECNPVPTDYALYGALPNPAIGDIFLGFTIPEPASVDLNVYDLSGRVIVSSNNEYTAGSHQIVLSDFPSGVYIVMMKAGEFTETRCFVVME